jgi:hypothetical protein
MRNTHLEQIFSALHPKADSSQTSRHDRFVPRTDVDSLLNHLIGPGEQRRRNFDAQSFGGLEVDD